MITRFEWTPKRTAAAMALAQGDTREQVASDVGVTRKTIYNWLLAADFAAEVDRLSSMVDISSRAHRLRLAMRVVRSKVQDDVPQTDKDLLDWLRFAQSETQGVKLDLARLLEVYAQ